MKVYPSHRYHRELGSRLVKSAEEDEALGPGWFHSPAEFGVETCPGRTPDPVIAAKKSALEKPETLIDKVEETLHIAPASRKPRRVRP
jgi:hypothetical protein